jgi:hypothetical protein
MNCHADAHATDYLNNWSAPSKVVSKASISLAGVTLTRNVARRLRQGASSPALAQHIMTANGWNAWILNSIAWDSQSKALGTLEHTQEIFVTKWAHNLLPTQRHMKRIGQAESDLCPSCLATIETAPHIFTCPKRVPRQVVFLDSLRKLLAKLHTQPDLQTILMTGIKGALQDDSLFDMPTRNREPIFQLLASSQNDIGWSHLLRGRFSRQWILLQQAHLDQDADCSSLLTGERWLQKVRHYLWTHLCSAWKLRNADLTGSTKRTKSSNAKPNCALPSSPSVPLPPSLTIWTSASLTFLLTHAWTKRPLLTKPPGSTCTRRPSASPKPQQQINFSRPNATFDHSLCVSLWSRETRGDHCARAVLWSRGMSRNLFKNLGMDRFRRHATLHLCLLTRAAAL